MSREIEQKVARVRQFLADEGLDVVFLTMRSNFSWITGGHYNYIQFGDARGVGTLAITANAKYLVANNIEVPRLTSEEIKGQGYEVVEYPWQEGDLGFEKALHEVAGAGQKGTDAPLPCAAATCNYVDVGHAFGRLRYSLLPEEIERFQSLGRDSAEAMGHAMRALKPGMTEYQAASVLAENLLDKSILPNLILVASDERIYNFRHPIPTEKRIDKYVMMVHCALRGGLIINNTRLVHFGPVPEEIRKKHRAVCAVEAGLFAATVPGAKAKDLWPLVKDLYAKSGYPDEWRKHHQGGSAGYQGRDWFLDEHCDETVQPNQAFAWNPSITGTKAEETFVATDNGPVILTQTPDWPTLDVEAGGRTWQIADILQK